MALLSLYAYVVAFSHAVKNDVYIPRAPSAGPEDFDCPMRQLALEFAMNIQPFLAQDKLQEIADALNGAQEAVNHSCVSVPTDRPKTTLPRSWSDNDTPSIYVDFTHGDDTNDGSLAHPLQHLDAAVHFARQHFGPATHKRIILRRGRHYLRDTVNFTAADNRLTLSNFDSELVELSGAQPINCDWQRIAGNDSWRVLPNTDGIFSGPPSPGQNSSVDLFLGHTASFAECESLVASVYRSLNLGAFTWQSSDAGEWSNVCYGIVGTNYQTNAQSNAMTGVLVNGANLYACKVTDDLISVIDGLRVNGTRAIRARYPNGNPETFPCGFCSTLSAKSWLAPTCVNSPTMEYWPETPLRNDTTVKSNGEIWFAKYQLGVGGCCDAFTPNAGYWCGNNTQGGGAFTYLIPSGLTYDATMLPNAPYANMQGAVIQTWRPGHWSSWMFSVDADKYDGDSGTIKFSAGGFQGARGNKAGDEFYVENVFEELDSATEWFFNDTTRMLYYIANGTDSPSDLVFEATQLRVLLNYTGTMKEPVEDMVIRGMTLRDTRTTYLDAHGMPSGGDWGLERTGAILLDGVKGVQISSNVLTRLDGNAISVNRYARDVVIERNEIVWNGDNAVSMWGDTKDITFADGTSMGFDGTDGNQPRGVQFVQNLVHEIGIWEKQSSMWFQAKSCSNVLDSNIFYNGPRAGVNFNDGFGGNSTLKKNLLFNTCRESGDHGPFNSWDRQVYVTAVRNGTASVIKEWDTITQNMMVANYNGQEGIDNDDGSAYYHTHENFFVYSGNGMKNDFGGHDNHHFNNVYGYISNSFKIVGQVEGHPDAFYNNTVVLNTAQAQYGTFDCDPQSATNEWPMLGDNTVYVATGDASKVGLCGMTEEAFQKANPGADDSTVIKGPPDNAQIIAAAKKLLIG